MKNEDKNSTIIKEQLRKEDRFIEYCNYDAYRKRKLGILINLDFLRAMENERLLSPILKQKETVIGQDGNEEKATVNYYSPFQIFMVAILSRNVVDSGQLRSPDTLEWSKKEGHHFISWGETSSFNAKLAKDKKEINHFAFYKSFHNFLLFLHSLEQTREYDYIKQDRQRYFSSEYPHLNFDFRPIEKNILKVLAKHKLNIKKLNELRANVGHYASEIDPLESWYYYLEKHPQWRKDQLKGSAILAQELYRFCDLIVDIIEMATNEKQKPLLDFLHPDIKPFGIENIEYASGTDFDAVSISLTKIKNWFANKKNKKVFDEALKKLPQIEQTKVEASIELLKKIEEELKEYEQRYGRRHYQSGMREALLEEKIELKDLDPQSKRSAESLISQHKNIRIDKNGIKHFITSYDEIGDKFQKGKVTLEEAVKMDNEIEMKSNIATAIEFRLGDIKRNLFSSVHKIASAFFAIRDILRRERDEENENLWREFYSKNPPDQELKSDGKSRYSEPYQERVRKFIKTGLPKGLKSIDNKIKLIKTKEIEVGEIANLSQLILCLKCRKSPVQLHSAHNDRQVVSEPICDVCLKDENIKMSDISSWKCDYCGAFLYRFANQNKLSSLLLNGSHSDILLEYGRLRIEIKCKKCKQKNSRYLDWGWKP